MGLEGLMSVLSGEGLPPGGSGQSIWLFGVLITLMAVISRNVSQRESNPMARRISAIRTCSDGVLTIMEALDEKKAGLDALILLDYLQNFSFDTYLQADLQLVVFRQLVVVSILIFIRCPRVL